MARESDFDWHEEPVPLPGPGQVLVRCEYLSVDPGNRLWMWPTDTTVPVQAIGTVMRGIAMGTVVASRCAAYAEGCVVQGVLGWQDYAIVSGEGHALWRMRQAERLTPQTHMTLCGHVGLAAYFGLLEIGQPRAGETLVVSSAAGAVGSMVGQIGLLRGCRVVGIAGSAQKCRWLREELGFDTAIDYKTEPVFHRLRKLCPVGIDVYFDNVGGPLLEDALANLNVGARVVACGMLSVYNDIAGVLTLPPGPNNLLNLTLRRSRMQGFLYSDYRARAKEAFEHLLDWHAQGRLQVRIDTIEGLRQAPRALNRLFDGSSCGKLIVRMS
ncbi:MAG: NADP-dependent oxidoreductase [Burkholderiales bacterium]|nr:NADP-dependent oxidoreductase [Burkholderiales bacterium]